MPETITARRGRCHPATKWITAIIAAANANRFIVLLPITPSVHIVRKWKQCAAEPYAGMTCAFASATPHMSLIGRFCCRSPLRAAATNDSVVVTLDSSIGGGGDDGAEQAGSGAAVLFVQSRSDRSGRPSGSRHCWCSRPVLGPR